MKEEDRMVAYKRRRNLVFLQILIPRDLRDEFKGSCKNYGMSRVLRRLIREYVNEQGAEITEDIDYDEPRRNIQ